MSLKLIVSAKVLAKLAAKDPPVAIKEIHECFTNRTHSYLLDKREEHKTDPPTRWFIAETHYGRKLKIAFMLKDGDVIIRSAFSPNEEELRIYGKFSSPLDS